jgi:hypothetical protein
VSLAGVRFTTREDRPYCSTCFGSLYAKKCDGCLKPIVGNVKGCGRIGVQ